MRIGIPRALHAFYHYPLWRGFISGLGAEVVLSPATDRDMLEAGIRLAPAETCLPLKAFLGHVAWLRERCDRVMVQRLVCIKQQGRRRFGCPKAICLPDLVKATVPDLPPVLELLQDEQLMNLRESFLDLGRYLNPDHQGPKALVQGQSAQAEFEQKLREGMSAGSIWEKWDSPSAEGTVPGFRSENSGTVPNSPYFPGAELTIGVIGHRYLLFDPALSLDLPARLAALGVRVCTASDVPEGFVFPEPVASERVNWHHEHELLAAARYFLAQRGQSLFSEAEEWDSPQQSPFSRSGLSPHRVDGLLLVSSFACGTAAVVNEIIRRELDPAGIPVMTILLDEHTAESGLSTRLEAFVDMVRHRKPAVR